MQEVSTLWDLLGAAPAGRTALIVPEPELRITYGSLREQVSAAADLFASAGIRPGDRVAMALPNGVPALVCFLAATIAGTAAPLNSAYRREEFDFFLEDTSAKLLIVPPDGAQEARAAAAHKKIPVASVNLDASGKLAFSDLTRRAGAGAPTPEQIALVLHTSGTTGRPKRVPLMHRNLAISAGNVAETYALTPDDVSMCVMPLFHVHGLVASVLATLLSGGTVVVPDKFSPFNFWRSVQDYKATWYSAVPTIHQVLLARAERGGERPAGAEHLRFIRSCSSALSADTMRRMEQVFGVPMLQAYGMTEASHQMASNPLPPRERKLASVGVATGVEISIVDADGNHLKLGEAGEVVIKGPAVMRGYENNPEANARSFTGGWFRTGDQGVLDESGYLRLVGRLKEMINRGGEKISPLEIDDLLLTHPQVAEAVSFGVEHPSWGEEVAAAVVLRESVPDGELLAFCKAHLAEYKCPKKIYVVEAIPRTATGKIQRSAVAAALKPAKA
ncbi:MAG TPA: acyl--CoA ligase [Candidatus Binataceae bacterium]|nr:acyl--CoA ligase [Candidatus Binataceae bacterium]